MGVENKCKIYCKTYSVSKSLNSLAKTKGEPFSCIESIRVDAIQFPLYVGDVATEEMFSERLRGDSRRKVISTGEVFLLSNNSIKQTSVSVE